MYVLNEKNYLVFQVRDLEGELESEQRRTREAIASSRRCERNLKEITAVVEDERRIMSELTSANEQMFLKMKTYKRQIEEAVSNYFYYRIYSLILKILNRR